MRPAAIVILLAAIGGLAISAAAQTTADSLTLEECLNRAERLNPDLEQQRARVKEAEAKVRQQFGVLLPQIDAGFSYSRYHEQLPSKRVLFGPSLDDYYAEVGLRQVLFGGGKYYYALRSAQSALAVEKSKIELLERQTGSSVRRAYYDLARTVQSAAIQRDLVKKLNEQLRVAELLYNSGKASKVDLLRIETQVETQKDNLANLEQLSYARAMGLGQVVGSNGPIWPREILPEPKLPAGLSQQCVRDSFRTNPELAASRSAVEKAERERNAVRGEMSPLLSLRMNYNREDRDFFPNHPNWYTSLTLSLPLFRGGAALSQLQQADSRIVQAEQVYRKTFLSLAVRFQTLRAAYLDKLNRMKTIRRIVDLSRQALLAAEVRYGAGKLSAVELFDAQQAWATAELNYLNTVADMLSLAAELEVICPNVFNTEENK